MALPILETPKFETILPSDGVKITFRPFTVKEQKNLLIVQEGADEKTAMKVLADCLTSCVDQDIQIFKRPVVDFEWLFLQVRSKSVGESVELTSKCKKCETPFDFELNLTEVEIPKFPEGKVKVTEDLTIEFRNVSMGDLRNSEDGDSIVASCAKVIYYKGECYTEFTPGEFKKFIEPLTLDQYAKVDVFFRNQPSLKLSKKHICKKCGEVNDIEIEGVFNFFI